MSSFNFLNDTIHFASQTRHGKTIMMDIKVRHNHLVGKITSAANKRPGQVVQRVVVYWTCIKTCTGWPWQLTHMCMQKLQNSHCAIELCWVTNCWKKFTTLQCTAQWPIHEHVIQQQMLYESVCKLWPNRFQLDASFHLHDFCTVYCMYVTVQCNHDSIQPDLPCNRKALNKISFLCM